MEKQKLTKLELSWILYDVGNSAFILTHWQRREVCLRFSTWLTGDMRLPLSR